MNSQELSEHLRGWVVWKLAEMEAQHFPGFVLPNTYAGHAVPFDSYCHLLKTLTLLVAQGVEEINGVNLRERSIEIVAGVDPSIEAFSSFGFGESVARLGGLDAVPNPETVIEATQSPNTIKTIDDGGMIPPNFKMVVTRCLFAEAQLSGERPERLDEFMNMTQQLFARQESGWVNDQLWEPIVHYDMYTPDMYVFAEPMAAELGDAWRTPFGNVLPELGEVAHPGGVIVWGRSSGLLALALTVELAAVGSKHGLLNNTSPWLARARESADRLNPLFPAGIIASHQNRSTMFYRGPERRLQMTFDILDKIAASALDLSEATAVVEPAADADTWGHVNRIVAFDDRAGVWVHRTRHLPFVLPFLQGMSADYNSAPRSPGLFEHPTGGHPCWLPTFHHGGKPYTPAGLPDVADLSDSTLTLHHGGWNTQGASPGDDTSVAGHRHATYVVSGRTLSVSETVQVDDAKVTELTIAIPELADRPLDIETTGCSVRRIDTSGVAEWRSYWNELPTVHQIEVPLVNGKAEFSYSVTARLRVASTIRGHWYDSALYNPIEGQVVASLAAQPDDTLLERMRNIDVLHMGWPEWWGGFEEPSIEKTRAWINTVTASGVKVLWTQHNLEPHYFKTDEAQQCYQAWAEVSDTVIHHSAWGRETALATYTYKPDTTHVVIPHGHWNDRHAPYATITRDQAEKESGWDPVPIRLAIVGAPRKEKRIQDVLDAFHATDRNDMQLIVRVAGGETVPDDPRIITDSEHLDTDTYHRRMRAFDALILPFEPHGMLTTGTAFDVMGAGLAAITSEWGFLDETFAGADIRYGSSAADLQQCLQNLTTEQLQASAAAIADQTSRFDWGPIAESTLSVLHTLCP